MSRLTIGGLAAVLLGALFLSPLASQTPQRPRPKRVLAWGDTLTAFQHDSISHALATMERLGHESGAYEMYIRTDSQLITKQAIPAPARNTRNLDYFDAIFYFGTGDNLTAEQKKDLITFVKDEGKGFVGAHTGDDAFFEWPEFGQMIGGYFDNHPWGQFDAPVIVEDPAFGDGTSAEVHHPRRDLSAQGFDRARCGCWQPGRLEQITKAEHPPHRSGFAVAWAKMYGKGRVFYRSTSGHAWKRWGDRRCR